eukprot:TRINITY_DN631_c0_g1_i1.p1 TRINITY_DN631_c0_g1~~TRINITY_DN631_c0_g1_i1.p1  ORF type:complete len:570 (-),score=56.27 TRINITY_DN631_c0_g1_i1:477-2186(-)
MFEVQPAMLSLTVSQRVVSRQTTFFLRTTPKRYAYKRATVLKLKCQQEVQGITDLAEQESPVQLKEQEEQQQEITTESGRQSLSQLLSEEYDPEKLLNLLQQLQHETDIESINTAIGTLRKVISNFRNELENNEQGAQQSLGVIKDCCNILIKVIRENMDSLDFTGVADSVWLMVTAKDVLQIHTEIDNFENVLQDLFQQSEKVSLRMIRQQSQKLSRLVAQMVDYLNENNKKYFDVLFGKLLGLSLSRIQRTQSTYLIETLVKLECTDLQILDKYIPHMYKKFFEQRNQVFLSIFLRDSSQLRYYDNELVSLISSYLENDFQYRNGGTAASIAQYVATLATGSENRKTLASQIVSKSIQKAEYYYTPDITKILYYTASAGCSEQEYKQLLDFLLDKLGENFDELSDVDLRMLRQAQMFQSSYGVSIEYPEVLQTMCTDAQSTFIAGVVGDIKQDEHTQKVLNTIQQQYQDVQHGISIQDGQVAIPILVENDQQKVAVVPVSNKDFVVNVPDRLLEIKKAEFGILKNLGYQVQTVESQKWDEDNTYQEVVMKELSQRLNGMYVEEDVDM